MQLIQNRLTLSNAKDLALPDDVVRLQEIRTASTSPSASLSVVAALPRISPVRHTGERLAD